MITTMVNKGHVTAMVNKVMRRNDDKKMATRLCVDDPNCCHTRIIKCAAMMENSKNWNFRASKIAHY